MSKYYSLGKGEPVLVLNFNERKPLFFYSDGRVASVTEPLFTSGQSFTSYIASREARQGEGYIAQYGMGEGVNRLFEDSREKGMFDEVLETFPDNPLTKEESKKSWRTPLEKTSFIDSLLIHTPGFFFGYDTSEPVLLLSKPQERMALVEGVYKNTTTIPRHEHYWEATWFIPLYARQEEFIFTGTENVQRALENSGLGELVKAGLLKKK
jgi:hypothetical protein